MKTNREIKEQTMRGFARSAKKWVRLGCPESAGDFARAAARLYFEVYGRCYCTSRHVTPGVYGYSVLTFCHFHGGKDD